MSKLVTLLIASVVAVGLAAPLAVSAAQDDTMACSVTVVQTRNNVQVLSYVQNFLVSPATPFFDDFSTSTRFRFFDASMTVESGVPVVSIAFDADVDVFNAVTFNASLKVHDERHGETTSGESGFFGTVGSFRTTHTLNCARA